MKKLVYGLFALLVAATPSLSRADVSGSGAGGAIPDGPGGIFTSTIVFGANETITGNVRVTLRGLSHTWAGDLIATLTAPDGTTTHTLFSRVGRVTTGVGDSSDYGGDYEFADVPGSDPNVNGNDLWFEATLGTGAYVMRGGPYRTSGADAPGFTLMDPVFVGGSTLGTWTLTISDNEGLDTGSLQGWSLFMESTGGGIPEPSSIIVLAGLAVGGLCARRRRA